MAVINGTPGEDSLNGTTGDDVIHGLAGSDVIYGQGGSDQLYGDDGNDGLYVGYSNASLPRAGESDGSGYLDGGAGDDVLRGGAGADTLIGGVGDDNLRGNAGDDLIDGGPGYDLVAYRFNDIGATQGVTFDASAVGAPDPLAFADGQGGVDTLVSIEAVVITGTAFHDVLTGSRGNDYLDGGNGGDTLSGGDGDDTLSVGLSSSTLNGGSGDDQLVVSAQPSDFDNIPNAHEVVDGGPGDDTLVFDTSVSGMVEFHSAESTVYFESASGVIAADIKDIEHIRVNGGVEEDEIFGSQLDDILVGFDGPDRLHGGSGNDLLLGGFAVLSDGELRADYANQDAGGNRLEGGDGDDVIYGGGTGDYLDGGSGNDTINGVFGQDTIIGGDGDDQLSEYGVDARGPAYSAPGSYFYGGDGDDVVTQSWGNDTIDGGNGFDTVMVYGFDGNYGISSTIDLRSGTATGLLAGMDHLISIEGIVVRGNATVIGTDAAETFHGIEGGAFSIPGDHFEGNGGDDVLIGGNDVNELDGGDGDDIIIGGSQTDSITGGPGADTLSGGGGLNSFLYVSQFDSLIQSSDTIEDFRHGHDSLNLRAVSGSSVKIEYNVGGGASVYFDQDDQNRYTERVLVLTSIQANDIGVANGAVINIYGSQDSDVLVGTYRGDIFVGRGGADTLTGGAGADTFVYLAVSDSTTDQGGNDVVTDFERGVDVLDLSAVSGASVNLYHYGYGGTGVFFAPIAPGHDGGGVYVVGDIQAADVVAAPGARFTLTGSQQGESLVGAAGDDVVIGGGGADVLTGGGGADTFVYAAVSDSTTSPGGNDVITDFAGGSDRLDLSAVSGGSVNLYHYGDGSTGVFFAPVSPGLDAGGIYVSGDVQAADVVAAAGARFTLTGSAQAERLVGAGGNDVIIGGGGADVLSGGGGADVFRYSAVSDSTPDGLDQILDFQHGADKIDLTGIAGGFVNIVHAYAGTSQIYYAPSGGVAGGAISVLGDVEDGDVLADPGTVFIETGSYASAGAPDFAPELSHPAGAAFGAASLHGHVYLA